MKALSDNLYFKNLDNNAGCFIRYGAEGGAAFSARGAFRARLPRAATLATLDSVIESYFSEELDCALDFDVTDAISKLMDMELVEQYGDIFVARALNDAVKILDDYWDNIYQPV